MKNLRLKLVIILLLISPASSSAQQPHWCSFEDALTVAKQTNKLVVVDVWAPWCGWCHKMKKETYPNLSDSLRRQFIFVRLNMDNHTTQHQYQNQFITERQLVKKLNVETVPALIILSPEGDYLFHTTGFLDTEKLNLLLLKVQ